MTELVILKLGGSVITKKAEDKTEVNRENLDRISREIAEALEEGDIKLVIVHGAGPYGHVLAKKYELDKGLKSEAQIVGFSLTHQSMDILNSFVVDSLQKNGVNAIEYPPSMLGLLENKKLVSFPTDIMSRMLELGLVPVSFGDVLIDRKTGINILSGDHLVPYLAKTLKADRVIVATDVEGIFEKDPKDGGKRIIKEITPQNIDKIQLSGSKGTDVTGGMKRKVEELLEITELGIESEVISALKPGNVKRAIFGEKGLGTTIKAGD